MSIKILILTAGIIMIAAGIALGILALNDMVSSSYSKPRDYQIDIHNDTIFLYDKDRYVGRFMWEDSSALGQLLLKDNQ